MDLEKKLPPSEISNLLGLQNVKDHSWYIWYDKISEYCFLNTLTNFRTPFLIADF
jgi:hypothetical protein